MPLLGMLLLIVQIAFAVHVVRSGRDRFWLYIIIFVPGIGCAVYFLTQVLPDVGSSHTVRRAGTSLLNAIDPQRELRRRKDKLAISDSVENRIRLADECVEAKFHDDAIELYRSCLTGLNEHDPEIMLKLARAQFCDGRCREAKETLETLIRENPRFRSTDGHLLYARVLEALELHGDATREYEILLQSYPGEEARVRFAMMLQRLGQDERARGLFDETLTRARRAPKHYRRRQKEWIDRARANS
jgi:hypothetical protein